MHAAGYRSIGDEVHRRRALRNLSASTTVTSSTREYPESLVYEFPNGTPKLVAAMYILPTGSRFSDIPPLFSGPTHAVAHPQRPVLRDNPADPKQKLVGGTVDSNGNCPAGQTKAGLEPMIHVWIVANPCGPFAALEGIGAGQVPDGQTRTCDSLHSGTL